MPVFNIRQDGPPVTSRPTTTTGPFTDPTRGGSYFPVDEMAVKAEKLLLEGKTPSEVAASLEAAGPDGDIPGYSEDVLNAIVIAQNRVSGRVLGAPARPDDPSAVTAVPITAPVSATPATPAAVGGGALSRSDPFAPVLPRTPTPSLPVPIGGGGPPGGMAGIKERFPAPPPAPPTMDETRLGRLGAEDAALARYIELLGASLGTAPDITGQLDARSIAVAKQTDELNAAIRNLGLDVPQSSATPLDATLLGGAPSNQQFINKTGAGRTDLPASDGPSMETLLAARVGGYSPELAVKAVLDSIGVRDAVAATESADKTLTDLSDELTNIREKKAELEVRIAEDMYATDTKEREKRADELAKKKLEGEEAKTKLNVAIRASKSVVASSPEASELFSSRVAEGIKRIAVDEATTPFAWRTEAQDFEEWDKLVAMLPPSVDAETASKLLEVLVRDGSGYAG